MSDVNVIIPTQRRPDHLSRALRSVAAQAGLAELVRSIVVVDNDPDASAAGVVDALRSTCAAPIVYVHEPRPGVATARNAGVAASYAPLVAFLDDDEEAPPHWLGELRGEHLRLGAPVTFGPVRGVAEQAPSALRDYFDRFFSREGEPVSGLMDIPFGCGNSMLTRARALVGPTPFDAAHDRTGGEDDRLFSKLKREGAQFGWAANAWVLEYAPAHRVRLAYVLRRAFAYGQGPSKHCIRNGDRPGLLRTMAIGAGQAGVYGAIALALALFGPKARAIHYLEQAVRGAGKIGWPIKIELYGLPTRSKPTDPRSRLKPAVG